MKNQMKKHTFFALLLCTSLVTAMTTGCGKQTGAAEASTEHAPDASDGTSASESDDASNEPETEVRDHNNPQFLNYLTPSEENPAISSLPLDLLQNTGATDIALLGDRILLINQSISGWGYGEDGEESDGDPGGYMGNAGDDDYFQSGSVSEDHAADDTIVESPDAELTDQYLNEPVYDEGAPEDSSSDDGDYYDEDLGEAESFGYSFTFTLYDPWNHEIDASLSFPLNIYDMYQLMGDRLVMFDQDGGKAAIYNDDLQLLGEYDISELTELSAYSYISGTDSGSAVYTYSYDMDGLLKVDSQDLSYEFIPLSIYNPYPETISPSGRYLTLSGVDKDTLRSSIAVYDTEKQEIISQGNGSTMYGSSASEAGVLRYVDYEGSVWSYRSYEGEERWYSFPDMTDARLLSDDRMICRYMISDWDTGEQDTTYILRDIDGKALSSFACHNGNLQTGGNYLQFATSYILLPECNKVILLSYHTDDEYMVYDPQLLVWDLSVSAASDIADVTTYDSQEALNRLLEETIPDRDVKTLIPDADSYDWGELADLQERATALEEKTGVQIFFGPEVPESMVEYNITQQLDHDMISDTLDLLEEQMDLYPENFISQLAFGDNWEVCIYISGRLQSTSDYVDFEPAAYVTETNNRLCMVIDSNYSWDLSYTFHHELSHMIDRRLNFMSMRRSDCLYSESEWASYNPEDFEYLYSYIDYDRNADWSTYRDWFIEPYAMTYPTEDRAVIFGHAMSAYQGNPLFEDYFGEEGMIHDKMSYYALCIRDGFNTDGWPELTPWESMLQIDN